MRDIVRICLFYKIHLVFPYTQGHVLMRNTNFSMEHSQTYSYPATIIFLNNNKELTFLFVQIDLHDFITQPSLPLFLSWFGD